MNVMALPTSQFPGNRKLTGLVAVIGRGNSQSQCKTSLITDTSIAHSAHTVVSRLWTATLVSGVVTALLGVLVLVWPGKSLIAASALFGAYLLISGIAQVVFASTYRQRWS